jgi:hypothetical protein
VVFTCPNVFFEIWPLESDSAKTDFSIIGKETVLIEEDFHFVVAKDS